MKNKLLKALELARLGKWEDAHKTVQDLEDEYAYWIHASLHREEGDISNSGYWYRRAKRDYTDIEIEKERKQIELGIKSKL